MTLKEQIEFGLAHLRAGRLAEAEAVCREIRAQKPDEAQALHLLGIIEARRGDFQRGMEMLRRAIEADPEIAKYHANLGAVLLQVGRFDEAMNSFRKALSLAPDAIDAAVGLGNALRAAGRTDEATAAYQQALAMANTDADASNALGIVLSSVGREEESLAAFRQAVAIRPDFPEALANGATVLTERGLVGEGESAARSAVRLRPDLSAAHSSLAKALIKTNRIDEAVASYEQAARLQPESAIAWNNLAFALVEIGETDRQLECLNRAMQLDPMNPVYRSNWINRLQYNPAFEAGAILAEARRWDEMFGRVVGRSIKPHGNDRTADRRLRIGYISPDLREHVVARNILPLFRDRDIRQFEVFGYASIRKSDEYSRRFESLADGWRLINGVADDVVAQMIRNDGIDVLVDLALHSAGNRLPVFARKPAPVQVTFAGYPGTTGLSAMDYRLTDPYLDPEGESDAFYSERSIRLPHSFWCYDPIAMEVAEGFEVAPLPVLEKGVVTFGCLNSFCKVNETVLDLWGKILLASGRSRLLMLAPQGITRQRVLKRLGDLGVDASRIEFVDRQKRADYLRTYNRIDVGLDTLPYNGHTTSLDSLWMGVPVVSLIGKTVVGRAGFSQLGNIGLSDLAADSPEQFVRIAGELAGDHAHLSDLRKSLRERMRNSPLTQGGEFVRGIEAVYRRMWRTWCGAPQS